MGYEERACEALLLCLRVTRHGGSVPESRKPLLYILRDIRDKAKESVSQGPIVTEAHYRVLKALEANPELSQRQLANELGISVGKANYCIKALINAGWVKARNFRNSDNKLAYAYMLTPSGIRRKTKMTVRFLEHRRCELEALRREIAELSAELDGKDTNNS